MFSQYFGNYLLSKDIISETQMAECMDYIKLNRVKLGLIAENEGLLTSAQAEELNRLQLTTDARFGDLAVKKGYLSDEDVSFLLSKQGSPFLIFVQALIEKKLLDKDTIMKYLDDFQKDNDFSEETIEAIKNADIDKLLPTFVETDDERFCELLSLTLRNVIRFVCTYIRIDKGYFVDSLSPKYAALQKTIGDFEGFLGFTCEDDAILSIATGYAKFDFDEVDEDALDSVAEFTNCVNGLYATELSYRDISIDMLPPDFLFNEEINNGKKFFVLPLYIENRLVNIIAQL